MLRLRNRLLPLLRAAAPLPSPIHPRACHRLLLSTSTSATAFSLKDYLVAACGLAPAKAREVSKKAFNELSREYKRPFEELSSCLLSSASNPDAILTLLSGAGLSRANIAAVVSADPLLLRASANNIGPRLLALRDRVGLSTPQIASFLVVGSRALRNCDVVPKLEFFISFYGSFEKVLVVAKRNGRHLMSSLERVILPNIALLRQWGVRDIAKFSLTNTWVLTFNPERVKEFLLRTEELGVPPTSPMFREALAKVASISKGKIAAKLAFFKRTFGCSESEVSTAVSKMPGILGCSDEILLRKIEFLVNEAALEPRYILERPVLLAMSLEKRLVPRHYVMKVLKAKGLLNSNMSFYTLLTRFGEETFKLKFIDCHKDSVPGLADVYAPARAEQAASTVASAVVNGITDRALTTVMRKLRSRPAAAHEKLQRLELLVLKLRSAVEVSEKHAVESASLLQWRDRLREAAAEGGAVVLDFQRRAREDGETAASASGTGQQQAGASSVSDGALYFTRSALSGVTKRVRDAARRLFSGDEDGALEKMEQLSLDITQFLMALQLEVPPKLGYERPAKRRAMESVVLHCTSPPPQNFFLILTLF